MAKLSRDFSVGNLHPRETVLIAGNLGALNAEIVTRCDGAGSFALDLRGTFNLTLEVSGSVDGVNWTPIPSRPLNAASLAYVAAIAGSTAGVWTGKCAPYSFIRARVTAYTSGTVVATLVAGLAALDDSLQGMVSSGAGTATGAAGAAVTLTLASPGAGLRHYITSLTIEKFAAALLTAATAPVVVTTTNLPGSLAFSFAADAAAQGTVVTKREEYGYPLAASAQNTATTFVAPLTTGVLWRISATFYVAP